MRVIEIHDTIQEEEDSSTDLCIRLAFYVCMLFKTLGTSLGMDLFVIGMYNAMNSGTALILVMVSENSSF